MRTYALSQMLALFTLLLPAFALPSSHGQLPNFADHGNGCPGAIPATVTVTVTASSKADQHSYSQEVHNSHPPGHHTASSSVPRPLPPELKADFNRDYHAFAYLYDKGYHLLGTRKLEMAAIMDGVPGHQDR